MQFASPLLISIALGMTLAAAPVRDRRVVDMVRVGEAASDAAHGYAEHDAVRGIMNGRPYRSARGWMRYAMATFDDTEVTIACTFIAPSGRTADTRASAAPDARAEMSARFELLVEDSLIAMPTPTRTLQASPDRSLSESSPTPVVVEVAIPFALTRGRTNIAVMIRARGGATPPLSELRVIQDHNEVDRYATSHSTSSLRAIR
jgi:hypothetical protein